MKKKKTKGSGIKRLFLVSAVFMLILGGAIISMNVLSSNEGFNSDWKFKNGYSINGVNVSGLTKEEARNALLSSLVEKTRDRTITIKSGEKEKIINCNDYELRSGVYEVLEEAQKISTKKDEDISKYHALNLMESKNKDLKVNLLSLYDGLERDILINLEALDTPSENAKLIFSPDAENMFVVEKEKDGIEIDKNKTMKQIEKQFSLEQNPVVNVIGKVLKSEVKIDYFNGKYDLISTFKTSLKNSQEGRRWNVQKALKFFNGMEIKKDEEVSFNAITGPQTLENGYKPAIIILNGEFTEGIGGGICQASTTLYNALLLSNVSVKEVFRHSLPVKYVPLGQDSMVSEGFADLKFKNTKNSSIFIKSYVKEDDAVVEIYGEKLKNQETIKVRSEKVNIKKAPEDKIIVDFNGEYDSKVKYKNEFYRLSYGQDGFEIKTYLDRYNKDGKRISSKEIRKETYPPKAGIVIEGRLEKQVAGGSEFD